MEGKALQGRELTEWEELAGGYAVFCHCLYQPTKEKYFQKAEGWLQDERIKVYAAMEENSLLGMIVLCIQRQQAEIVGISVCPQERHRGIGSWLIEAGNAKVQPDIPYCTDRGEGSRFLPEGWIYDQRRTGAVWNATCLLLPLPLHK